MKKYVLLFVFTLVSISTFAQKSKTCDSPEEESLLDLSSITKCSIKKSKKSNSKVARQISVRVSAPKRRFLKRRKMATSEANKLNAAGVNNADYSSEVAKTLALRNSVANLTNTLSAAEVRKAEKFMSVDTLPKFEACKGVDKDEEANCFNTEMIKHIEKYFSYPSEAVVNKTEGNVWVRFVIDANGTVTNIKTLAPENGELLSLEAKRVVSKLTKFIPANKNGKNVAVKYGFPINFSLDQ